MSEFIQQTKVNVNSEDGELKEIIYGCLEDFRIPQAVPTYKFVGDKFYNLLKEYPGSPLFSKADPIWYKKANDCIETVVKFLESKNVVVHRPRSHSKDAYANFALQSSMNCNVYSRDSLVSIGNTLVETSLKTPERIRDKYSVRYLSMELSRQGNRVISCPQPLDTYNNNPEETPLIEGGDILIDNAQIYIGDSGMASNHLGYEWIKSNFPEFEVHHIKISTEKFQHQHLDCLMTSFAEWGIIYENDIIGGIDGLPAPLREKKWIHMTFEEAHTKLGNILAINPKEVIMAEEAGRLRKEVEALGITVHAFPYKAVSDIGGSFRCNSCPIYRV